MLEITIPGIESFDEETNKFVTLGDVTIELEHSLVSLSKWESKWKVPFLGENDKTPEQTIDYVRAMTLTENVDPGVYDRLSNANIRAVSEYIDDKMTATWFRDKKARPGAKEIITAEIVYYWMISMSIPFECQNWHLNRLLTLIKVCGEKNDTSKKSKMSKSEMLQRQRDLNAQRRSQLGTSG